MTSWLNSVLSLIFFNFIACIGYFTIYFISETISDVNDALGNSSTKDSFQGLCWSIVFILFVVLWYFIHKFSLYINFF